MRDHNDGPTTPDGLNLGLGGSSSSSQALPTPPGAGPPLLSLTGYDDAVPTDRRHTTLDLHDDHEHDMLGGSSSSSEARLDMHDDHEHDRYRAGTRTLHMFNTMCRTFSFKHVLRYKYVLRLSAKGSLLVHCGQCVRSVSMTLCTKIKIITCLARYFSRNRQCPSVFFLRKT